jgi:carbamoyltransferase
MNILGISAFYHDSAAALLSGGEIMAAVAEERFSRKKHDNGFPLLASEYCLASTGKTVYDVDAIAFYDKPLLKFERVLFTHFKNFPMSLSSFLAFMPRWIGQNLSIPIHIQTNLKVDCPIYYVNHHESHAASAFYSSPFDRALIFIADGVGDWATTSWGIGEGNRITLKQEIRFPHSLGLLYSAITAYLGFPPNDGEGTVMGLAAYGEPAFQNEFDKLITVYDDGSFVMDQSYFTYSRGTRMFGKKLVSLLGPAREPGAEITKRHQDIAATLQAKLEGVMARIVRNLVATTGIKNLCLAGGTALNCVANGYLLKHANLDSVFIQPAAGDDGGALGAAQFVYHQIFGNDRKVNFPSCYLGPEYSTKYVESRLKKFDGLLTWSQVEAQDLVGKTAQAIADDQIIGWFQGRMEFGPRALGNRSILANPKAANMKDLLNLKIKKRESFRPFAPAILNSAREAYFELSHPSPHMLLAARVCDAKRGEVPAICHVDGTARIQTVEQDENPLLFSLLTELQSRTGTPIVLNTSFNLKGEPIVCTPEDAIDCFMRSELDILVINNFWIKKSP